MPDLDDEPNVESESAPFTMVPNWVLDAGLSAQAVLLYLTLRRAADWGTKQCVRSRRRLAAALGFSKPDSVDRYVAELVEAGAITVERRLVDGENRASRYYVRWSAPVAPAPAAAAPAAEREVPPATGVQDLDPSVLKLSGLEEQTPRGRASDFDRFWAAWPGRKVGKPDALRAYTKAARVFGGQTILDGARRLADDPNLPEQQFIPHPATWLNRQGWGDDPYPARTATQKPAQESTSDRLARLDARALAQREEYLRQSAQPARRELAK